MTTIRLVRLPGRVNERGFVDPDRMEDYVILRAPGWFFMDLEGHTLLPDFLENQTAAALEERVRMGGTENHVASAYLLSNGRHFVCMYRQRNGSHVIVNDIRSGSPDPDDAIYADYRVLTVLFVRPSTHEDIYTLPPTLPENQHNRCLGAACLSMLMRIPFSWWERVLYEAPETTHDTKKYPITAAILNMWQSERKLHEEHADRVYRKFLAYSDGKYGECTDTAACLFTFFREITALKHQHANLNPGAVHVVGDGAPEDLEVGVHTLTALVLEPRVLLVTMMGFQHRV